MTTPAKPKSRKPPAPWRRKSISVTLAPETFAAIEQRLKDNPGLGTASRAIDDLILRPTLNPSPNPIPDPPQSPAKASKRPK